MHVWQQSSTPWDIAGARTDEIGKAFAPLLKLRGDSGFTTHRGGSGSNPLAPLLMGAASGCFWPALVSSSDLRMLIAFVFRSAQLMTKCSIALVMSSSLEQQIFYNSPQQPIVALAKIKLPTLHVWHATATARRRLNGIESLDLPVGIRQLANPDVTQLSPAKLHGHPESNASSKAQPHRASRALELNSCTEGSSLAARISLC